jgi:hypothetical protein
MASCQKEAERLFSFPHPLLHFRVTMKLEQSFEVTATAHEIEARVGAFMQRNGYHPSADSTLRYSRGSRAGSLVAFSPRKWQTQAVLNQTQLGQSRWQITLALDINDEGQIVTQHERLYWKNELDQFQQAVQTGESSPDELAAQERAITQSGVRVFLISLGTGLIVGLAFTLMIALADRQARYGAIVIGTLCGFAAGLIAANRSWRR